jgi:hypothetical protein
VHFGAVKTERLAATMAVDTTNEVRVLRHVVLFSFHDSAPPDAVDSIRQAFCRLPERIDSIVSFEWGLNNSPEGINQGFTHCFLLGFASEADRDAYLIHPVHQEFVAGLAPHLAQALVVDYWAGTQ